MSHDPPPNPEVNDAWIDDDGELKYFNGRDWAPYQDLTTGADLPPELIVRGEPEKVEEKPEGGG